MKRITFADRLDEFLETASEQEVRDVAVTLANRARWKGLGFRVEIKQARQTSTPLLGPAEGGSK